MEEQVQPAISDTLLFLGDYIDRGPNSADTISYLLALQRQGLNVVAIRGNHEQMLLDSINSPEGYKLWMRNGGNKTVESYGQANHTTDNSLIALLPDDHVAFYQDLPLFYRISECVYAVHGGIVFPINTDDTSMQKMLWLRPWECVDSIPDGVVVIHGHTPVPLHEVKRQAYEFDKLVNLDAGCVYAGKYPGLGFLTCLNLETKQLLYTPNIEE